MTINAIIKLYVLHAIYWTYYVSLSLPRYVVRHIHTIKQIPNELLFQGNLMSGL
jgi:hypothetical protein